MKAYNKENIPLAKVLRKNMTPWERKLWYNFCETIRCVFKGKKRLETISQTFIVQKRDWLLNLTEEGTIHRNRQKKMNGGPMI